METEKKCTSCGESYPATNEYFHKHRYAKDGLSWKCKSCGNQQTRAFRNKKPVVEPLPRPRPEEFKATITVDIQTGKVTRHGM